MTRSRRALLYAGTAAVATAWGGWVAWRLVRPDSGQSAAIEDAFRRTLLDHRGQRFELASLRGRTVVLNFWATWCPPCIEEMPELATLHREIADRNGTVVGIGIDSPSNIREFAEKHQFPYPLLVAGTDGTQMSRELGNKVGALPFTVVIDAKGRMIEQKLGRIRLEDLRAKVLAAIADRAA